MRLYICGPMRGIPFYNAPAFDAAAERLRADGDDPVSPADIDRAAGLVFDDYPTGTELLPPAFDLRTLIRRDLDAIDTCDGLVRLPGWENSRGSAVEIAYAEFLGMPVFEYEAGL